MAERPTVAHVYRLRGQFLPQPESGLPADHRAVVLSRGPWVLVYGNQHDGWREWGGGYNMPGTAVQAGDWLTSGGSVTFHEPVARG